MKLDAIITNGWNRIGYNIVRSLGRRGLKIGVGVDGSSGMSVVSRYNYKTFHHPSFDKNEEGFIESVRQAILTYNPTVYIPSAEDIFVVAKYREMLDSLQVKIPIASLKTLNLLDNKNSAVHLAKHLGIPIPQTIKPKELKDVDNFFNEYGSPIVLKILKSSASRGVFYLQQDNYMSSLENIMKKCYLDYGDFIIQEFVNGTGYGVSMLFNHGELLAKFTHKRLREKILTGGPSTLRVSVKNPLLEEYAERLLRHVGYHGVAMVEFKNEEKSQNSWFIEVNPRFWGSLSLGIHSGVDFPYLLYKMALEDDVTPVLDYKTGIKCRWILGDILAVANIIKSTKRLSHLKLLFSKADAYDDLYVDDPLPFIVQFFLSLIKFIKTKIFRDNHSH